MVFTELPGGQRVARKDGFSLIEVLMDAVAISALLVVVALIGVQSALALPRLSEAREAAHREAMRRDLQNLAAHQAIFHADRRSYAPSTEALAFETSRGVEVEVLASPSGWWATATHAALDDGAGCAIYVGEATPPTDPVTPARAREIACTE